MMHGKVLATRKAERRSVLNLEARIDLDMAPWRIGVALALRTVPLVPDSELSRHRSCLLPSTGLAFAAS